MSAESALGQSYFLSYSRADQDFALRFATDLRSRGISMWVDQLDIRPSEHWDRAIERAVRDCRGLVVILSPRSVASDNVADEISYAIDSGKSVLPVMIERCTLPLRITRMQVVDATADVSRALQQCLDVLGGEGLPAGAVRAAASARAITDIATLAKAKERLTSFVGPIASLIVDKEAARAGSADELYSLLADRIDSERERQRFLALARAPAHGAAAPTPAKPQPCSIPQSEVERLASALTVYIGPIAAVVARREAANASSVAELQERLASLIPNHEERADFLRRAES